MITNTPTNQHEYPWAIDGRKSKVLFKSFSENEVFQAAFLDNRINNSDIHAKDLVNYLNSNTDPISSSWIFHTSFCASTLLAKLLQVKQGVLVMKEPKIFNDFVNISLSNHSMHQQKMMDILMSKVISSYSKKFHTEQKIIIKVSNFANVLLNKIEKINPQSRVILVWGGLDQFINSMSKNLAEAKKAMPIFLKALSKTTYPSVLEDGYVPGVDLEEDIVRVWAQQVNHFGKVVSESNLQIRSVTKDQIQTIPLEVVSACDRFYGISAERSVENIEKIMNFDSKSNRSIEKNSSIDNKDKLDKEKMLERAKYFLNNQYFENLKNANILK